MTLAPIAAAMLIADKPDAAASVDDDPFARLHLRAIDDAVKRRHEAAAHRGRLDEVDALGQV